MQIIFDSQRLNNVLIDNPLVLVYFSSEKCNVCNALKPKIESLVHKQFPSIKLVEIPTQKSPELVGIFRMFVVPSVLLFVEGREYLREVRNVSTIDLTQKIEKIVRCYK